MPPSAATCVICHAPLPPYRGAGAFLCDRFDCRRAYDRIPENHLCSVCGRPLNPRAPADGICDRPDCRQAVAAERAGVRAERKRRAAEARVEQARELRDEVAGSAGIGCPTSYRPAVIPSFAAPVVNVPEIRRRAFRDQLNRLIGEATAGRGDPPPDDTVPRSPVDAVVGQACARCRGDCCRGGGDHAYLTPDTIRRFMAARPDLRPRDVLAAYLARVGNKTCRGSCIFHGSAGCTLPRDMRSDTCNQHFCDGMKAFLHDVPAGPVRGFFVTTADGEFRSAAFIDEAEVRLVRLPPPETPALS